MPRSTIAVVGVALLLAGTAHAQTAPLATGFGDDVAVGTCHSAVGKGGTGRARA
jgi:hypothetical protein